MGIDYELMVMGDRIAAAIAEVLPGLSCWHQPETKEDGRRIVLGVNDPEGDRIHSASVVFLHDGVAIQEKRHVRSEIDGGFAQVSLAERTIGRQYGKTDFRALERDLRAAIVARPDAFDPVPLPGIGINSHVGLALSVTKSAVDETAWAFEEIGGLDMRLNSEPDLRRPGRDVLMLHTKDGERVPMAIVLSVGRIDILDADTLETLGYTTEEEAYAGLEGFLVERIMRCVNVPEESPRP